MVLLKGRHFDGTLKIRYRRTGKLFFIQLTVIFILFLHKWKKFLIIVRIKKKNMSVIGIQEIQFSFETKSDIPDCFCNLIILVCSCWFRIEFFTFFCLIIIVYSNRSYRTNVSNLITLRYHFFNMINNIFVGKDMDVYEHERLFNIILRYKFK